MQNYIYGSHYTFAGQWFSKASTVWRNELHSYVVRLREFRRQPPKPLSNSVSQGAPPPCPLLGVGIVEPLNRYTILQTLVTNQHAWLPTCILIQSSLVSIWTFILPLPVLRSGASYRFYALFSQLKNRDNNKTQLRIGMRIKCQYRKVWRFLIKLNMYLACHPENSIPTYLLWRNESLCPHEDFTQMFMAALLIVAPNWKQPECLPMGECPFHCGPSKQ